MVQTTSGDGTDTRIDLEVSPCSTILEDNADTTQA